MSNELDRQIIRELQRDLPIVGRPYAAVAARLGVSEDELLKRIRSLMQQGAIRRISAVLRHRRIGFTANALCVWQVPAERMEEVGELFSRLKRVTHCYERCTCREWPYNLYTMVHALSREECERHIHMMSALVRIHHYRIFYSMKELKKVSMRYFDD